MSKLDRRLFLGLLGAGAAPHAAQAQAQAAVFAHGVASGDPLTDRVILWTRVSTPGDANVSWEIAEDSAFSRVIKRGTARAEAARDRTVKVDADGLSPGREYWYRFRAGSAVSPAGRTRTLPSGATPDVVLAVASCSLHPHGYFNAYRAIADLPRLDAVIHLGDYIYEYGAGPNDYGMANGARLNRRPEPPREIVSLSDYRTRHAQYKSDPDLQAAHARAPWICVWDDHESADNSYDGGASNHQAGEGDWGERKAACIKAYFEWMPIREPARDALQRSFDFGDLASLIMVETRIMSRTKQLDYGADLQDRGPAGLGAFRARLNDRARQLLGAEQRQWLAQTLRESRTSGRVWQVIGNQVVMAKVVGPDILAQVGDAFPALLERQTAAGRARLERNASLFALGLPLNLDAWDGYPAERELVYAMMRQSRARPIVLAGDIHSFWANNLHDAAGTQVGVELATTSITSPSSAEVYEGRYDIASAVMAQNPREVAYTDWASKGFLRLTLRRDEAIADMMAVSTITERTFTTRTTKSFRIRPGADGGTLPIEAV